MQEGGQTSHERGKAPQLARRNRSKPSLIPAATESEHIVPPSATETPPPEAFVLLSTAPAWWKVPAPIAKEAALFDARHATRVARAERFLHATEDDPGSPRKANAFSTSVIEVERNRYCEPPPKEEKIIYRKNSPKVKPPPPPPKPWSLYTSIWAPRAKWCDAKDFVDTDEVEWLRFEKDWQNAVSIQNIDATINKADDEKGAGASDEVEECRNVFWDFHDLFFALYTYYACISGDIGSITLNAWSQLVEIELDVQEEGWTNEVRDDQQPPSQKR